MRRLLVTHADDPVGRRVVKTLHHDPQVERVWALGAGPAPRAFDAFLAGAPESFRYTRIDLARHRPVTNFFHSARLREARIDTLVHVPAHGAGARARGRAAAGVPARTTEVRALLQHCLESDSLRSLVALGSAFVYRLRPGNANRMREDSELELDPDLAPELRSWVDADMLLHGEVHHERLRVVLLRVPSVVASGGGVYWSPALTGTRLRPLGFDPLCAVVSDKDVAKAVRAAVHAPHAGIYNVAGVEALPLSQLARWTGRPGLPAPRPLLSLAARAARALGAHGLRGALDGTHRVYGFTLDTRRAERELGFRPGYRVGVAPGADGRPRLETTPA